MSNVVRLHIGFFNKGSFVFIDTPISLYINISKNPNKILKKLKDYKISAINQCYSHKHNGALVRRSINHITQEYYYLR